MTERSRIDEAHRKARAYFAKNTEKEAAAQKERRRSEAAMEEKIARLRSLRLAKEAADREAAERKSSDGDKTRLQRAKTSQA